MNPSPMGSAFHAVTRALALAVIGFVSTISPMAVIGGLVVSVATLTVAVVVIVWRFGCMTKEQRLDLIELARALRQSGK